MSTRDDHLSPELPAADARLLAQVRRGDADAGHQFVREYYPGVYRYLLYLTGRPETAEDLTQETFLQAWRRLDTFEGRAPLRPWLHRIAHREFLQARRRRRDESSLDAVGELPAPRALEWIDAVEMRAVLRTLPLEEREMMVLHYVEGYNVAEIARIMGAPVGRVKDRLLDARARMRTELGEGDLSYLNQAPAEILRRWSWLPLAEMGALEARLRRVDGSWRTVDGSERGSSTPAGPSTINHQRSTRDESAIVDNRLTRKISLAVKATALGDVCDQLRAQSGIRLAAGPSVADEKVTLFCRDTPLRDVMRQLSRPFGYTWIRSGKPGEYQYELAQDLRAQLMEEELRNRDRNTAFLVLEREIERYRLYLDLSPDEALARAKNAPPEERKQLEMLGRSGWGAIQLYFRLTPQQLAALRSGEELHFSQAPKHREVALPSDVAHGVLQSLRDVFFHKSPDGFGISTGVKEPKPEDLPPTAVPEARATLDLSIRQNEPGVFALKYVAGAFSRSDLPRNSGGATWEGDGSLAIGTSPAVDKPDNRAANARLARDPALRRSISVQPVASCQPPSGGAAGQQSAPSPTPDAQGLAPEKKATSADVMEALHKATGLPIVSDFYTRLYPPAAVSAPNQPLFEALNQLADTMHLRWNRDGEWLQFRSASYYDDRIKEVPNRLLSRWAASRRQHGALTLDDLAEIAGLTDAQLDAAGMAEGAQSCWGLLEWQLARHKALRTNLRFLAELTSGQRQEAARPIGLPFTKMSLPQQQRFITLALQYDEEPLQSLDELAGSAVRVEYTRPGGFEWIPPGSNWFRWVVPVVPGKEGRRALLPAVYGPTLEETLAVARRLDSHLLEAIVPEARRLDPHVQSAARVPTAGEIVPTRLNLRIVYVPGLSNRRDIYVVDLSSDMHLGTW